MTAAIYPMITAVLYYLLARAEITKFVWSRYTPRIDRFMTCAACTGFWYGLIVASFGWAYSVPFIELPAKSPATVLVVGLCSIFWTPVVAWLHLAALDRLGAPVHEENPGEP